MVSTALFVSYDIYAFLFTWGHVLVSLAYSWNSKRITDSFCAHIGLDKSINKLETKRKTTSWKDLRWFFFRQDSFQTAFFTNFIISRVTLCKFLPAIFVNIIFLRSALCKMAALHFTTLPFQPNKAVLAQGKLYFCNICHCTNDVV